MANPATSSVPVGASTDPAIPAWLAWKVFHESLTFYARQSTAPVDKMLGGQFGLTTAEATALMGAGQSFIQEIERIDSDARAEVQARYGSSPAAPRNPQRSIPVFPAGTIFREPGKTLRDMVVESGLYDDVEARKRTALVAHLEKLEQTISPPSLAVIGEWVQTDVTHRIKTSVQGIPVPGIDRSSAGDALVPREPK